VAVVVLAAGGAVAVVLLWPEEERVTVPDVVGLSTESAERVLEAAGLALGDVEYASADTESVEADTVFSQDPAAGSEAESGSEVAVVIGETPGDATEEDEEATPPPAGSGGGSGSEDAPESDPEAGPDSNGDVHFDEPEADAEPAWHAVASDSGAGDSVGPWFTTSLGQLRAIVSVSSPLGTRFVFDVFYEEMHGASVHLGVVSGTPTPTKHLLGPIDAQQGDRWRMRVNVVGDESDGEWSYQVQEWR
jgi:hypothetical protein